MYKNADLLGIIQSSEPFSVRDVGTFWPLVKTEKASVFYIEIQKIPPHYHRKTEETFTIIKGKGTAKFYPPRNPIDESISLLGESFEEMSRVSRNMPISPTSVVIIPPFEPHEIEKDKNFKYIGAILVCDPPLDPKDEIGLEVKT